jgi:hypothetical protein
MKRLGVEAESNRELFLLNASRSEEIGALSVGCHRFVCLIAWDARKATDDEILRLAGQLCGEGCVYICCWGPDCERVHDLFDQVTIARGPQSPFVMSTWHAKEPLSKALCFAMFSAHHSDEQACLGIAIGSNDWGSQIRRAFERPEEFHELVG